MKVLDSDIFVDMIRRYAPAVTWLASVPRQQIVVPGLVALELIHGCRDKAEQQRMSRMSSAFPRAWPGHDACESAMSAFEKLRLSEGLGFVDALIAHTAIERGLPLLTFNEKNYRRIPGIVLERPYVR